MSASIVETTADHDANAQLLNALLKPSSMEKAIAKYMGQLRSSRFEQAAEANSGIEDAIDDEADDGDQMSTNEDENASAEGENDSADDENADDEDEDDEEPDSNSDLESEGSDTEDVANDAQEIKSSDQQSIKSQKPATDINNTTRQLSNEQLLEHLLLLLLSPKQNLRLAINCFARDYLIFGDIKYFTLKVLHRLLRQTREQHPDGQVSRQFSENVTTLLTQIRLPLARETKSTGNTVPAFCGDREYRFRYAIIASSFAKVWINFLALSNTPNSYKKILAIMDSQIMPHFASPLSLTDFLINSYKIGGSCALLSLSSLFLLMTKYNLEYPDFYNNFYNLISPEVLYVKYRSRFLYWTDIFLSSTSLPAYLVAAFIKKLSRLTLLASVDALLVLIPLIGNLLVRHPKLHVMINRIDNTETDGLKHDPFDFDQTEPKQSNAMQSSLWELRSLQKHWHPKVREEAKFINRPIPKMEYKLSNLLETTFSDLQEQEFEKDAPDVDTELDASLAKTLLEVY